MWTRAHTLPTRFGGGAGAGAGITFLLFFFFFFFSLFLLSESDEDAEEYAEFLAETLPLLLFETTRLN